MEEILKRRQEACRKSVQRLTLERVAAGEAMVRAKREAEQRADYHTLISTTLAAERARLEELEALEVELRVAARRSGAQS